MISFRNLKYFWLSGAVFGLAFLTLFSIRLGVVDVLMSRPKTFSVSAIASMPDRDTWMEIIQDDRKIGYAHTRLSTEETGYRLREKVFMRINTMGMVQDINLMTRSRFNPDFTLAELDFEINSGRFRFAARGVVNGKFLEIQTQSAGKSRDFRIELKDKPYLFTSVIDAVAASEFKTGDRFRFDVFDPATMGQEDVTVEIIGPENVHIKGVSQAATKVVLRFKEVSQLAWIGQDGQILKEKGMLGISLIKSTRRNALYGIPVQSSSDLTKVASVPSNIELHHIEDLESLKIRLSGIPAESLHLQGGRQVFENNILTVTKEDLTQLPADLAPEGLGPLEKAFLRPSPFIQSDDQKIKDQVEQILGNPVGTAPLARARKLVDWIHDNIEKRPVISVPDALSTLENRMGDCNEHAVLLAAMARAAGIPARIEAGLAYLNGRFYYHAWNLLYVGRWVTADSVFRQLPADVSHLRFVSGSPDQQLDIMAVIGKVQVKILP